MPDLSILTVTFHNAAAFLEAQRSLARRMPSCDFEWCVVNHAPEESVTPLSALASHTRIVAHPNQGFAAGVNRAARLARAPILFLANPDLEFDGALLDQGLARLAAEPGIGALAPALLGSDGELQRNARRFYTWLNVLFARLPGRDRLPAPAHWRHHLMMDEPLDRPIDVDWLLGAAMFVRRAALRDPAGDVFDPRYFLYFEDVDLCMDLWRRGWRVTYDPTLRARHAHVRASRTLGSYASFLHAESFVKFVAKWRGLKPRPQPSGH